MKKDIENIIKILVQETKRIKKKNKKFSPVSIGPITRPMGSIFSMDAAVSENLNEGVGQKPVPKKFDHLKWKLNQSQKHFLDDFINIPDETLKEKDYEYASKMTGIPVKNIKSIKNTYADLKTPEQFAQEALRAQKELGLGGGNPKVAQEIEQSANSQMTDVRDLPKEKTGRQWSMNPNPEFRNKSLSQIQYEDEMEGMGGRFKRMHERELPSFMYEWLMYFMEGSDDIKLNESKLMNDFNSSKFDNYKFVFLSIDSLVKESGSHPYDNGAVGKIKEILQIEDKLKEFNSTFGTNFMISNQYTGSDGFLKVVLENFQRTDGRSVENIKMIDMSDTDIKKAISLGYYDQFTTNRSITANDPVTVARNIIG